MRVAIMTTDKDGALQTRLDNRAAHLAYIEETRVVEMAGPFLNDAGTMCGSLIVLEVADLAAAHDWAANDPYAKAGLFSDVRIQEWKKVIG
ncbi:YciI family protein [Loktanella sp. IMCC34160]|uniref:YciI family protein n=1 Tax=Loktanella sp. IMCC34160 TaxID=2510646 RepID=UPI00101CE7A5|nr:YciI family protein [Loktanella sp. IMCC34160]RYG91296.1 YciI family protein [Loktanella sp. IMCC34160]